MADGSLAIAEVAKQQIEELVRVGHNPRFIEVLFTTPGRKGFHICQERCSVAFDWNTYLFDRAAMKPQCLQVEGRRAWEWVAQGFWGSTRSGDGIGKCQEVRIGATFGLFLFYGRN